METDTIQPDHTDSFIAFLWLCVFFIFDTTKITNFRTDVMSWFGQFANTDFKCREDCANANELQILHKIGGDHTTTAIPLLCDLT